MSQPLIKLATIAAVMGLVLAAVGPVAAATDGAGNDALNGAGNQSLDIGVQQGAASATVAVTNNSTPVADANVTVFASSSYAGAGSYTTDEAGTVSLPLPGPNETVTIDILAEKEGLTGSATVTLVGNAGQGPGFVPPGQRIAALVHALQSGDSVPRMGLFVSSYVQTIVPSGHGAGPAWAGSPTNRGPPAFVQNSRDRGPPAHAQQGNDDRDPGPPEHARAGGHGNDESDDDDDSDDEGDDDGGSRGNGHGRGPPS